jgi:hypothetical protein
VTDTDIPTNALDLTVQVISAALAYEVNMTSTIRPRRYFMVPSNLPHFDKTRI